MTQELYHIIIRVPKEHSAFTYFQLEANEGLAFYSTLKHANGQVYRDIDLKGPKELETELRRLLEYLSSSYLIEYIKEETIQT
jgi:hypothetical protein